MKAECSCRSEVLSKRLELGTAGFFCSVFVKDHFHGMWVIFSVLSSRVMNWMVIALASALSFLHVFSLEC